MNENGETLGIESTAAPARVGVRSTIAVGGGRGGVGKSLVASNIAVFFAQLGKRVVLVDADGTGANLHAHFGLAAHASVDKGRDHDDAERIFEGLVETPVPGLALLTAPVDPLQTPLYLRAGRKSRWQERLQALNADLLVLDAGPGYSPFAIDALLGADVPICVTMPEPTAVESTYRFLRACFRRRFRRALARDRYRLGVVDRVERELGPLPAPIDMVRAFDRLDRRLSEIAWSEAQRIRLSLVVNQTRVRTDLELGGWMSTLSAKHLGPVLDELGHVEHDDTVWTTTRRAKPLLVDNPTCKAARNIERIARRLLAVTSGPLVSVGPPVSPPAEAPPLHEVLGVGRAASDEEIRRAYKRQKEVYSTGGLATVSLLAPERLMAVQGRIEEAYDTLLDPLRRRAYELSAFPDTRDTSQAEKATAQPILLAEQLVLQAELAKEIGPDTEFTGALLRKVREAHGIEIVEISARTKIARAHLQALEDEDFGALPAPVYVRGFVSELAKYLRLDPAQVQKTYLRRLRQVHAAGEK